jgi:hypothetical protein
MDRDPDTVKTEHWVKSWWRPLMAYQYMVVCLFDFMLAPIATMIFYGAYHGTTYVPWAPITLQGGAFYHIAMGAIVGVATWGRTLEKREAWSLDRAEADKKEESK